MQEQDLLRTENDENQLSNATPGASEEVQNPVIEDATEQQSEPAVAPEETAQPAAEVPAEEPAQAPVEAEPVQEPEEDFDDYDRLSPEKQATYKGKITFEETFWFDISNFFGSMNVDDDNQETENQGDDNSDSQECPCTTATARKHAKKPRRKADNKDAKA